MSVEIKLDPSLCCGPLTCGQSDANDEGLFAVFVGDRKLRW